MNKEDFWEKQARICYKFYYKKLIKISFDIIKDFYLAQDVVQEAIFSAVINFHQIKNNDKLESWLKVITVRKAIDLYRIRYKHLSIVERLYLDDPILIAPSTESILEKKLLKEDINYLINKLSNHNKELILLKYKNNLTEKEIADLLSLNVGTVKSGLSRTRKKLRLFLEKEINHLENFKIHN